MSERIERIDKRREAEIKTAAAGLLAAAREYVFDDSEAPSSTALIDRIIEVQLICPPRQFEQLRRS